MAPWDLMEQPLHWREWAKQGEKAEAEAQKQKDEAKRRRTKVGGGSR